MKGCWWHELAARVCESGVRGGLQAPEDCEWQAVQEVESRRKMSN